MSLLKIEKKCPTVDPRSCAVVGVCSGASFEDATEKFITLSKYQKKLSTMI